MTQVIADETLKAKLNGCRQAIEVIDEAGKPLGHYVPEAEYKQMLYAWVESQCPYSKEDLERFSKETGGRSLTEILKSLGQP
jgi:hypothetical protein